MKWRELKRWGDAGEGISQREQVKREQSFGGRACD